MNLHFDISTGIAILCVFSSAIIALVKRRRNRKCASCGHVLSRPYNFCAKCGYKVSDEIFQSQDLDAYVKNKMKTRKRYFNLALATTISIPILPLAIMLFFSIKPHEIMDAAILDIKVRHILILNIAAIVFLFSIALDLYLSGAKCPVCGAYIATKFAHGDRGCYDRFCRVCGFQAEEHKIENKQDAGNRNQ